MIHDGHRERLRKKFLKDPTVLEDHELLELLLFYSIPRANTNDTAHELIERFGSIRGVFDADVSSLKTVKGVGDTSAILIRTLSEVMSRYERTHFDTKSLLENVDELEKYIQSLFIGVSVERVYFLLFNGAQRLTGCELLTEGDAANSNFATQDVLDIINRYRPVYAVMAHNHPSGRNVPSGADIYTTNNIFSILKLHNVNLLEHFIVAGDEIVPILKEARGITPFNDYRPIRDVIAEDKLTRKSTKKAK